MSRTDTVLRCRPGDTVMVVCTDSRPNLFGRIGTVVMSVDEGLVGAAPEKVREYAGIDWVVALHEPPSAHFLNDRVVMTSEWALMDRHLMPISRVTEGAELAHEEMSA